jgi:hypothetical protein
MTALQSGTRTIALYRETFVHTHDDYSIQHGDGRYLRAKRPLTDEVLHAHLQGHQTIGVYLLNQDDYVRYGVLDHDDKRILPDGQIRQEDGLGRLQDARRHLARQGIESALEESRRGGHLWVFAREPVPAREMRALLRLALDDGERERMRRGERSFEFYPKQDHRGAGVGSALRAPCGVHQKSGERYPFVDDHGQAVATTLLGQVTHAAGIARVDVMREVQYRPWLRHEIAVRRQPPEREHAPFPRQHGRGDDPISRWVAAVDCRVVVSAYGVQLDHAGVGRCPWPDHHAHGDRDKSFQVGRNNRWWCHTLGDGGSALDFVMRMEHMTDPRAALRVAQERWPVPDLERRPSGAGRGHLISHAPVPGEGSSRTRGG